MIRYALHGFLGLPSDWETIGLELRAVDLFCLPLNSFSEWVAHFHQRVLDEGAEERLLLGYSLGGRLALHALVENPSLWRGAILISTHPGLSSATERQERLKQDRSWAQRFLNDPWEEVMKAWNGQQVFAGGGSPADRRRSAFDRNALAEALVHFSLGKQKALSVQLSQLNLPLLWVVGERDRKFVSQADVLRFAHQKSVVRVIPDAGHRLLWDRPLALHREIEQFLGEIT